MRRTCRLMDTHRELRSEGKGVLKIGRTLGVGTSAVQRVLAERHAHA